MKKTIDSKTTFSQKYTVIHFFKPLADGAEFASVDWPPHITLAETFAIGQDTTTLTKSLSAVADTHRPIQTTAGDDAYFGPDNSVHVVLITMTPALLALHSDIITTLETDCDATFNHPNYVRQGYRAHSTVRPDSRLNRGDSVTIDSISIVDMFPNSDPYKRKVIKTFAVGR